MYGISFYYLMDFAFLLIYCLSRRRVKKYDSLERLVITDSLGGQRGRGRPPVRWSDQIENAMDMPISTALQILLHFGRD